MYRKKTYVRRIDKVGGCSRHIVTVIYPDGFERDVVVTEEVFNMIDDLYKGDLHLANQDERHNEFFELNDEVIYGRAARQPHGLEDLVTDKLMVAQIARALKSLPPVHARRFLLRVVDGLTFEEISGREGCSYQAVQQSVDRITKEIQRILNL